MNSPFGFAGLHGLYQSFLTAGVKMEVLALI